MIRINFIASLIDNCNSVIDIGSDHAYLAINLLKNKKTKKVFNVEINQGPLNQGISNLKKHNLLSKTQNILNDGLKDLDKKIKETNFDYLTISGMGANNIIKILQPATVTINKQLILQPNNNEHLLRQWLLKHNYSIIQEHVVYENNIYYPIIVAIQKSYHWVYSKSQIMFAKYNLVQDKSLYYQFLLTKQQFLLNQINKNKNISKKKTREIKILNRVIKKYESKRDI